MMTVDISHQQQGVRHAFFIERDGRRVAEQTLSAAPDGKLAIIDHTEVDDSLRGQGVARLLTLNTVEWARKSGVKLVPVCPFAKAIFDKEPSLHDVLA
jgi:predicted GNAT family acetyltransferase